MRRWIYFVPAGLFIVLVGFFLRGLWLDPKLIPSPMIDKPAPTFATPALMPNKPGATLDELKGRVTLVNFFASWCVPCQVEHPLMMQVADRIEIIGINYKDKPQDALAWLARLGDPYKRIGVDRDGRVAIDFGVYGVPESYLLDREGRIRFKQTGPMTPEVLEKTILPMVQELSK